MKRDELGAIRRLIQADIEGEVRAVLDGLIEDSDDLELDPTTLEVVRLRFEARFTYEGDDDE